ncbi:MAG: type VII secretion protein EssC [Anaerolineaceae bacterium]|nr:type VII secretion protein EssC [Anaerolineaceae bacterium]
MAQLTTANKPGWGAQTLWVEPHTQVWKRARQVPMLPAGIQTLNPPGPKPEKPKFSAVSILVPLASLALMGGLYAIFFKGRVSYMLLMIPATLLSVGGTVGKYFSNRKKYYQRVEIRKEEYRQYLSWECDKYDRLLEKQQTLLAQINPAYREWYQRILQATPQVWERSVIDADYLCVRVGMSAAPASFQVIPPNDNTGMDMLVDTARSLSQDYKTVDAPLTVNLQESSIAVVGNVNERNDLLRSLVVQLTAAHSPDDVRLAVMYPGKTGDDWGWMRWLPHIWTQDHTRRMLADDRNQAEILTDRIVAEMKGSTAHWYVVIPDPQLLTERFMGPLLAEIQNPDSRLHLVTTASTPQMAPNMCRAILVAGERGKSSLWLIGPPRHEYPFLADSVSIYEAEAYARALAPLKMVAAGTGEIPDTVPLFDVLGEDFTVQSVIAQWSNAGLNDLQVPIGMKAGGKMMVLDLHETGHGPHGLIAGTTGSGKSELIQTLVVSLASHFPPDQLAFMLIDYKGGGTGQAFAGLPHLAGTISNLDESLAKRALVALRTEVEKRQRIFNQHQITHIDEYLKLYREGKAQDVLPRLVIIVDEFAELAKNMTDFLPELVSIARVGRSLGVHLILATQKPAGVVNDQIWSNARFKLCLKVQDVGDSKEMLKKPDAAYLTRPGRAYIMVGHDEMYEQFQSGYGGAVVKERNDEDNRIFRIALDGRQTMISTLKNLHRIVEPKTQISAAVEAIQRAFEAGGHPSPDELWVAPLPKTLVLDDLPESESEKIIIGMADDPVAVKQIPLVVDLNEGHLQIIGAPGTGKSIALQTFVLSLAKTMTPKEAAVYILDLDKRHLRLLEKLPHVGAVVLSYEEERMTRLFMIIQSIVNERRAMTPAELEKKPWVLLLIDNFPALMDLSEAMQNTVIRLSRETGGLKMMMILTATTMLNYRISSNFSQAIALNMIDPSEYTMLVGPTPPRPAHLPGRGLVRASRPMEVQIAAPASGTRFTQISKGIERCAVQIARSWKGKRAMQVPPKPDVFYWNDLKTSPGRVSMGIHRITLRNFQIPINSGEYITVTGTSGGGKTNLLLNIAIGLAKNKSPEELALYIGSPESRGLNLASHLPQTVAFASTLKDTETLLGYVSTHLQNPDGRQVVMLLDNFELIFRSSFLELISDVIGYGHQYHLTAICAGPAQVMAGGDRILRLLRERRSIWLGEIDPLDAATFGFTKQRKGGKGKGYINLGGEIAPLQTAIIAKTDSVIKAIQGKYPKQEQIPEGEKA